MTTSWLSKRVQHCLMAGAALAAMAASGTQLAMARSHSAGHYAYAGQSHARHIMAGMGYHRWYSSGLQCVPFARDNSGIELSGNAANWWGNASGLYERGSRPEVGSVLNFRASGRMRLGHVAVVSNVIDGRTVEVDHANWSSRGAIRRNVRVLDVSAFNDWTAVRVALGSGDFGSVYPTYGFIYDRPDHGTMLANAGVPAARPVITLRAAPFDLRPAAEQTFGSLVPMQDEEVAEASDDAPVYGRRAWRQGRAARYGHTVGHSFASSRYGSSHSYYGHSSIVGYRPATTRVAFYSSNIPLPPMHAAPAGHSVGKHGRHRT